MRFSQGIVLTLIVLFTSSAMAGYYEVGFSGNFKKVNLPSSDTVDNAFDKSFSYTGSIAYYFAEMAAVELNVTKGEAERYIPSSTVDARTTHVFSLIGVDLIYTLAKRGEPFIPYVKVGVAYFVEKFVEYNFFDKGTNSNRYDRDQLEKTFVPSVGFGLKFRLTDSVGFKIGLEAWTSDAVGNDPDIDYAGRAGVSYFF